MTDFDALYEDKYALMRVAKSVELGCVEPFMSVLDVGCNSQEVRKLLPANCEYFGVDKDLYEGETYLIDFDGYFSVEREFDRVFCLETLEHLKWPRKTLKSIKKHLKPSSMLVVSLPNEATLFHRLRSLCGVVDQECFSEKGKHLHLPSLEQARRFLTEEGFQILEEQFYISKGAGSRQGWIGGILELVPDRILQLLADSLPSLFARGFIFKLRTSVESHEPSPH